ncbi:inward rectifying shaker-like K+ channel [Artemisia annua]|uniref:Inward rectifying shaker-like K+ channel n=1 Tax=Artemisia annua TaxID=35608 RepID=A0A2U1LIF4_ARTAN|nr:inward rectifying shaker-like K+ channel [Artemisia annua]
MEGVLVETENMLARGRMNLPLSLWFATLRGNDQLLQKLLKEVSKIVESVADFQPIFNPTNSFETGNGELGLNADQSPHRRKDVAAFVRKECSSYGRSIGGDGKHVGSWQDELAPKSVETGNGELGLNADQSPHRRKDVGPPRHEHEACYWT